MGTQGRNWLLNLINGPLGVFFVFTIARLIPPKTGYRLAESIGKQLSRRKGTSITQAVRANQWVVSGCKASSTELDALTRVVFINHGRCLYDFYRNFNNPKQIDQLVSIDDKFMQMIEISRTYSEPQILVMPHFSNFDLAARAAGLKGLKMQVLSYPNPGGGYRLQNKLRNFEGIEVTPISISSMRKAVQRLEQGGTILTGVDRPYGESECMPSFFNRPANLPCGYIRLAQKTGATIRVILCSTNSTHKYHLSVSDPVYVKKHMDTGDEVKLISEEILRIIEGLIKANPEHWSMFYPVWPELLAQVPNEKLRSR